MQTRILVLALIVSLVLPTLANAQGGTIIGNYVGCLSESALDEFTSATASNDRQHMLALISDNLCFVLNGIQYSTIDLGFLTSKIRAYAGGGSAILYVPTEAVR